MPLVIMIVILPGQAASINPMTCRPCSRGNQGNVSVKSLVLTCVLKMSRNSSTSPIPFISLHGPHISEDVRGDVPK